MFWQKLGSSTKNLENLPFCMNMGWVAYKRSVCNRKDGRAFSTADAKMGRRRRHRRIINIWHPAQPASAVTSCTWLARDRAW
jgi:hypothetical protein